MASQLSRRSVIAGATAVGSTIIVKPTRAADHKFVQYHNQPAGGTLHKNLVAMWDAVRGETNGRVEATVYAENNKIAGGDPEALKKLLTGEIQFFTLMGGIIGTVVPVAEAQQVRWAVRPLYRRGDGGKGHVSFPDCRFRQRHAAGHDRQPPDRQAGRFRRDEDPRSAGADDLRHFRGVRGAADHDAR